MGGDRGEVEQEHEVLLLIAPALNGKKKNYNVLDTSDPEIAEQSIVHGLLIIDARANSEKAQYERCCRFARLTMQLPHEAVHTSHDEPARFVSTSRLRDSPQRG